MITRNKIICSIGISLIGSLVAMSASAENHVKYTPIPNHLNFQDIEVRPVFKVDALRLNKEIDDDLKKKFWRSKYDIKTTNGSACQPINGWESTDFNHTATGTVNTSFERKFVSCPIVRDNVTTKGDAHVRAYVETAGAGDMGCAALSLGAFGTFISGTFDVTTVIGNNELNMYLPSSAINGNYVLVCSMPEKSRISSYRLTEKLSTDDNS